MSLGDTVTSFGFWTASRNDTHSDYFRYFPRRGCQVCLTSSSSESHLNKEAYIVKVNGTHLAADSTTFLEKRRRGLVRFSNALVRHPILNQEQLVVMFLTVPTVRKIFPLSLTDVVCGY